MKTKCRFGAVLMALVVSTYAIAAHAAEYEMTGRAGERCSEMCPRAIKVAEARCEDRGDEASIKECSCDERVSPPTATVIYSCK